MSKRTLASLVVLAFWLLVPTSATGVPDGGASPDTTGTAVQVWPKTLVPGDTLNFKVTGFPAGETIYVKIDDGENCSAAAVHGACVIHQQRIPHRGAVQGSFRIPSDIGNGEHWLRFLASAVKYGPDGERLGVDPFTLRGASDFTVSKATTSPSAPAGDETKAPDVPQPAGATATPPASTGTTTGTDAPAGAEAPSGRVAAAGEVLTIDLGVAAQPVTAAPGPANKRVGSAAETPQFGGGTDAVRPEEGRAFPLVGVLALVIGVLAAVILVRRPSARG